VTTDAWFRTAPRSNGRDPPDTEGIEGRDGEWHLRVDYYDRFIRDVTGIETTGGVSPRDLKTIQCRLEGCVETYEREGSCACDAFGRYEHVESIGEVRELARFFRAAIVSHVEAP